MNSGNFSAPTLPHYVRAWQGEVRQATAEELDGVEYDESISADKIFWHKKPGSSEYVLVVRSRCNNCQRTGNPCIRDDCCNYCYMKGLRCTYPTAPMLLPKRPVYGDHKLMIPISAKRSTSKNEVTTAIGIIDTADLSKTANQTETKPVKKQHKSRKQKDAPTSTPTESTNSEPPPKKKSKSRPEGEKNSTTWSTGSMDGLKTRQAEKRRPPRMPYIWAESYDELCGAVPLLSVMNRGVSADLGSSPLILVNDDFWSGTWNRSNIMQLTTSRAFSYLESAPPSAIDLSSDTERQGQSTQDIQLPVEDVEMNSDSDEELLYPNEEDGLEASSTNESYSMTLTDMWQSFPPRLDDDSVKTYLSPLPVISTARSCSDTEDNPSQAPISTTISQEFSSAVYVPERRPEEISTLYNAYEGGIPVSVIISTDWTRFPFLLDERRKYAVLGFFHIINIETSVGPLSSRPSKKGTYRVRGQRSWTFVLRWTPGGPLDPSIPLDIDGRPRSSPAVPWWLFNEHELAPSMDPSLPPKDLYEPFLVRATIIASTIFRDAFEGGNGIADASRRAWLCTTCGKLNMTNWIGVYACSRCSYRMPCSQRLFTSFSVRDRQRFVPMWEPSAQIPKEVTREMQALEDGVRTFTYTIRYNTTAEGETAMDVDSPPPLPNPVGPNGNVENGKRSRKGKEKATDADTLMPTGIKSEESKEDTPASLVVQLIFLGNRTNLEGDADKLFLDFQKTCPMRFERTESKPTAGIYTFQTVPDVRQGFYLVEGYSTWSSAPEPVMTASRIMMESAERYVGKNLRERAGHFSAMAWLGESPVKTEINACAKESPVLLMCLGADVHIIFPKQGEDLQLKSPSKSKSGKSRHREMEDEQDQISRAGINGEIWGDGQGKETNKALMAPDRFRITLTHGSILIISGHDIGLTVMRSDFAILVRLCDGR